MNTVAVLALIALVATAAACSGSTSTGRSPAVAACGVGRPVDQTKSGSLPPCTNAEPRDVSYSYACLGKSVAGQDPVSFFIIYLPKHTLYGIEGGTWKQGPTSIGYDAIKRSLHC